MLNLFPQGLEGTLVIPILVGVLVMAAFTEVLGWDFVGVVVPGYLAAVFLLEPVVGVIVLLEAVVTWALAVGFDRLLTSTRVTFPVFGRDRFFLVLAASIAVRMTLEGFVLQGLVTQLSPIFPALATRRHELFGIGLVLVPLTANRLWNPGLFRGLFQLAVESSLVALVLHFVLVRFTNFSLAGFDPTYDPLALSFLTSPRAQIGLLITSSLASFWNRRYGWDFHGILVPALLGLAVISPIKVAATLVESILIVVISRAILMLPRLRDLNVEGARRAVLCFCVGVIWKMTIAHTVLAQYPGYRPTDLLGFGYMLPSLLAERIWLRQNAVLVFLPTLQTAVGGFLLSTAAAFGLAVLAPVPPPPLAVFPTLPQAVLAWASRMRGAAPTPPMLFGSSARSAVADTNDGYRLFVNSSAQQLIALRSGVMTALVAPLDEWSGIAALAAVRANASLFLGDPQAASAAVRKLGLNPRPAPRPEGNGSLARSEKTGVALARNAIAEIVQGRPHSLSSPALAPGAALQIDRNRGEPEVLARMLSPYELRVTVAGDKSLVIRGEHWPTVVLRPGAKMVVTAPYVSEVGAPGSAVFACEELKADCVLAHDDDEVALPLGTALAEHRGRAHLIVRGTQRPLGADMLLLVTPESVPDELPPWMKPLNDIFAGRLSVSRRASVAHAPLVAFPVGAGRLSPTALLWLSPFARRVMSGSEQAWWSRPDILELVKRRGMPILRVDALVWLADGKGAPSVAAIERAERLARTEDVAQLTARVAPDATLALLLDEDHGLAAFAIDQGGRRGIVMSGDRREERITVGGPAALLAMRQGMRTLLAPEIKR